MAYHELKFTENFKFIRRYKFGNILIQIFLTYTAELNDGAMHFETSNREPTSLHHLFQSAFRDISWLTRRAIDVTFSFSPRVTAMYDVNQRDQSKLRRRRLPDSWPTRIEIFMHWIVMPCSHLVLTFVAHLLMPFFFFEL